MMIYKKIVFLFLLSITAKSVLALPNGDDKKFQKKPLKRIVIDAGHGGSSSFAGKFYGASSKFGEEKDITLSVALKLQEAIKNEIPDVEVIMTRTSDIFDSPIIKANKANDAKGDLFISIHCNDVSPIVHHEIIGYTTKTIKRKGKKTTKKIPKYHIYTTPNPAKGTETYIWGVGKTKDKEDALIENDFIDTTSGDLKGFDPNDPVQKVEISLRTQQYFERSRKLAETVEEEFVKGGRISRGAKQRDEKGIWVLQAVNMPAILIEIGFLSNDEEGEYITSEKGQQEIAASIVQAIKRYKFSLDNKMQNGSKG